MKNIDKYCNGHHKARRIRKEGGGYTVEIFLGSDLGADPVFTVSGLTEPESMQLLRRIDPLEYKPKRA